MAETNSSTELKDIKMLMILQLLVSGVKQRHIAAMLGISEATMSRMMPKGFAANLRSKRIDEVSE